MSHSSLVALRFAGTFVLTVAVGCSGKVADGDKGDNEPSGPVDTITDPLCWTMTAHNGTTAGDTTKLHVRVSEYLHRFAFRAAYTVEARGRSVRPIVDNAEVVATMRLYEVMDGTRIDLSHEDTIGQHMDDRLVTAWAPGGETLTMPPGVGLRLPPPDHYYELEILYSNSTSEAAEDASGFEVCATSEPMIATAALTMLGTDQIAIAPNSEGVAAGTCTPLVEKGDPEPKDVTIIASIPHMHRTGVHLQTVINRKAGAKDVLVDTPFDVLAQKTYLTPSIVNPGDTLTTTCTFDNQSPYPVSAGPSLVASESCANFVLAYPDSALNGRATSVDGTRNSCFF